MDFIDIAVQQAKQERKRINAKKHEAELEADSDPAAHPLVKDARFLRTAFFPDSIPACFEE